MHPSIAFEHATVRLDFKNLTTPHAAALAYASAGWAVIPLHHLVTPTADARTWVCSCQAGPRCSSPGKHPRTPHGLKDASTSLALVNEWWSRWRHAGVGLLTGPESGLFVLDIDAGHGGYGTLAMLEASHPAEPALLTLEAATGGGGSHLVFAYPGGEIGNSASHLQARYGPGIDIRGKGGYIVAPPTLHRSGRRYQWVTGPDAVTEIRPAPEWVLKALAPPERDPGPDPAVVIPIDKSERRERYWVAALRGELIELATVREGDRNNSVHRAAFRMGQLAYMGARLDQVQAALVDAGTALGLPRGEASRAVTSGLLAGKKHPRGAA